MTYRVVLSPEAEDDINEILEYIAEESSSEIAERYTSHHLAFCESLATFPIRGTRRDLVRPGLRTVGFRRRVSVAYVVEGETVTVLRFLYAGQEIRLS